MNDSSSGLGPGDGITTNARGSAQQPPPARSSARTTRAVATRLSLDGGEVSETTAAAARSPAIGGLLRFSPHSRTGGTTGLSPYNRGRNNRTRFFGNNTGKTTATTTTANGELLSQRDRTIDGPLSSQQNGHANPAQPHIDNDSTPVATNHNGAATSTMDGIYLDDLRDLTVQALLEAPGEATFYAGLLYSKTRAPQNALLLAQAYSQAQQHSSCLRLLEESNIIQSQSQFWTQGLLLACASLAAQGEWTALVEILEDACRLADPNPDATPSFRQPRCASTALSRPLEDDDDFGWETLKESISAQLQEQPHEHNDGPTHVHPLARLCVWRGRAYYETGHVLRAAIYWKRALRMDSRAVEAWQALLEHALVTPTEAHDLLEKLEFAEINDWLKALYLTRIEVSASTADEADTVMDSDNGNVDENHLNGHNINNQNDKSSSFSFRGTDFDASSISITSPIMPSNHFAATPGSSLLEKSTTVKSSSNRAADAKIALVQANVNAAFVKLQDVYKLQDSPQVLAMSAKRAYRRYQWKDVLKYCEQLAEMDPTLQTGGGAAYVYVAALLIAGHKRTLFSLAHEWVEGCPKSAQAWFAVGAYYSCCGRHHVAQRHFCRATRLDPQCTEAWIAFGCSFAACDESDQALASFRAAQRLSPGEFTSLLYMGMEYNRTNHLVLAHNFLNTALQNSGGDPLCWHELGVLASNKGDYKEAVTCFGKVLAIVVGASSPTGGASMEETVELCVDPYWEATVFNLGHALRKTRQYQAAATCYARCISLCPEKCSGYSAYAFTSQMMGKADVAVEYYHQALSCRPDDNFSTEMLSRALGSHLAAAPSSSTTTTSRNDDDSAHRFMFPMSSSSSRMSEGRHLE
jgi:tetratricopeptide (TPR) repeat protein